MIAKEILAEFNPNSLAALGAIISKRISDQQRSLESAGLVDDVRAAQGGIRALRGLARDLGITIKGEFDAI
jgi:hypothetical protein